MEGFLGRLAILDWTDAVSVHYARIRSVLEQAGRPIGNMDLLIAAHAVSQRMTLVTNNPKHFAPCAGSQVRSVGLDAESEPGIYAVSPETKAGPRRVCARLLSKLNSLPKHLLVLVGKGSLSTNRKNIQQYLAKNPDGDWCGVSFVLPEESEAAKA